MRVLRFITVPVFAIALWSCFSTGNWDRLSSEEQDRFRRCSEAIRPALCGTHNDTVYVVNCMRSNMSRYADNPNEEARHEWLMANGCPPSQVDPRPYVSSGGQRDRPPTDWAASPARTQSPSARDVPDRAAVATVMQEVQRRAESCLPLGVFQLRLVYGNDGNVILVTGDGGDVPDSVLACVREQARAVPLPPFTRTEFTVSYPFRRM